MNARIGCIVASVVLGSLLIVLLVRDKSDKKENFKKCICSDNQGGREQVCQDTEEVNNLYVTGELTESSPLMSKGWSEVSPGDITFPKCEGCTDPPNGKWVEWDFTDFGN